jgi:hypothetical protein
MAGPSTLPLVAHRAPLDPATDRLIAVSARKLALEQASIWRGERVASVTRVDLISLNRLGGEAGYSGSQFFVAAIYGKGSGGRQLVSQPLLLKLVEGNIETAEKLRVELERYNSIRHTLPARAHARPIGTHPAASIETPTRLLWSDFVDEQTVSGLPFAAPTELRHILERFHWQAAEDNLRAAYRILTPAHDSGATETICYYKHYSPYLRLRKGWLPQLRRTVDHRDTLMAFGIAIRNPLSLLAQMKAHPKLTTGPAHLSAVHGDLHPKNILVGDIFKACLIDFGWANDNFHTIIDFVFMEASIKFFRLPWHARRSELVAFERALVDTSGETVELHDQDLKGALALIRMVRSLAAKYFDESQENWFVRQYLIPLFFVTTGLFPYAASVVNLEHLLLSTGLLAAKIGECLDD